MNSIKARYATRPEVLQSRGDGSYLFNYDIAPEVISAGPAEQQREGFVCSQVVILEQPTKKAVKRAVIAAEFSNDEEKKLINDFNAFSVGSLSDQKYQDDYLAFLERRKAIKLMIDNEPLIVD